MDTHINVPARSKPNPSSMALLWVIANSIGAPLAFMSALIVAYLFGFVGGDGVGIPSWSPEQIMQALYGGVIFGTTAGLILGLSQYLVLKSIPHLGWWIPVTAIGFAFGAATSSILAELIRFSIVKVGGSLSFVMPWALPALFVVLLQAVVLFRARYPIGVWLLVGWAPILLTALGYSLNGCVAVPGAIAGAIISVVGVSVICKKYELSVSNLP